jgi:hypothetical protein
VGQALFEEEKLQHEQELDGSQVIEDLSKLL